MLIEIKDIAGDVIFSLDEVYNSNRRTVERAVKEGIDLRCADLRFANLLRFDLQGVDLRNADLSNTNLACANLRGANLQNANLRDSLLEESELEGAILPKFKIVPETGEFFGYKKLDSDVIIKVKIPEHADRTNAIGSLKCRASEVEVVKVVQGEIPNGRKLRSTHFGKAMYAMGEVVKADWFDPDIRNECTHGIHFFMTLEEAEQWF
jgi:hypothetical protein